MFNCLQNAIIMYNDITKHLPRVFRFPKVKEKKKICVTIWKSLTLFYSQLQKHYDNCIRYMRIIQMIPASFLDALANCNSFMFMRSLAFIGRQFITFLVLPYSIQIEFYVEK